MTSTITLTLTEQARGVIAGLLAPTDTQVGGEDINHDGIYADDTTWAEIARHFHPDHFRAWAATHGGIEDTASPAHPERRAGVGYDPDAGL